MSSKHEILKIISEIDDEYTIEQITVCLKDFVKEEEKPQLVLPSA